MLHYDYNNVGLCCLCAILRNNKTDTRISLSHINHAVCRITSLLCLFSSHAHCFNVANTRIGLINADWESWPVFGRTDLCDVTALNLTTEKISRSSGDEEVLQMFSATMFVLCILDSLIKMNENMHKNANLWFCEVQQGFRWIKHKLGTLIQF